MSGLQIRMAVSAYQYRLRLPQLGRAGQLGTLAAYAGTAVTPADATIRRWWRDLNDHRQIDGRCPVCGTRGRCRPRAEAYGDLT